LTDIRVIGLLVFVARINAEDLTEVLDMNGTTVIEPIEPFNDKGLAFKCLYLWRKILN